MSLILCGSIYGAKGSMVLSRYRALGAPVSFPMRGRRRLRMAYEGRAARLTTVEQARIRAAVANWDSQDARDHFEERAAIVQFDGGRTEAEAEQIAFERIACRWCEQPHTGGPENCEQ